MTHDDPDLRAYLGMPGYGELTAGAARGFWRSTRLPDDRVCRRYREGSLLAANFNAMWVEALNLCRDGRPPRYFAMQHADIEPEDWWLDTLIDELEAKDLDILGAVAPIKDTQGMTSIALARTDGDPWRILCRLTMAEVFRLPETFTARDTGHPILLNTGLWVCRFDPAWAEKVWFTIRDRIAFDTRLDRYVAECVSEDWGWSWGCHQLGLKLGATRKVKLQHRGSMAFANWRVWGTHGFDSARVALSQIPSVIPDGDGFAFPWDIAGWLTPAEGKALAELARGERVLEIGSYCGLSTVCMARTAKHITAVDPHDGRATPNPRDTFPEMGWNLQRYGVAEKVTVIRATIREAIPRIGGFFGLIFVDGAHDVDSVEDDIACARELLAPGGLIAFHDYRSDHRGVTEAVDRLVAAGGEIVSITDSLAVVRPPAEVPASLEV